MLNAYQEMRVIQQLRSGVTGRPVNIADMDALLADAALGGTWTPAVRLDELLLRSSRDGRRRLAAARAAK